MMPLRLPDVEAVGFDLDGTLLDHPAAARAGVRELMASIGMRAEAAQHGLWAQAEDVHFRRWIAGETDVLGQRRARIREVFAAIGVPVADDASAEASFDVYAAGYRRAWQPYPDVVETLERLRAQGLRIGVLTNGVGKQQRAKLAAIGVGELVDVTCAADELGVAKPHAAAFAALTTALGVAPERTVFVGDDPSVDVAGARDAGIRAALVRARGRGVAELPSAVRRAAAMPRPETPRTAAETPRSA